MSSLVVDNRLTVQGPGMHVLLVGVSRYEHLPPPGQPVSDSLFGFRPLASPAMSAAAVFRKLTDPTTKLARPVKTCRLLLDVSPTELVKDPTLAALSPVVPTRDAFALAAVEWRDDAYDDSQSITLFYFAGHGLERGREDMVMAMADFGSPADVAPSLNRCASLSSLFGGMAPTEAGSPIAATQFYFIDACRAVPSALSLYEQLSPPSIFPVKLGTIDDRMAPKFLAAVDGSVAIGRDGMSTIFGAALVDALACGAEDPVDDGTGRLVWPINVETLRRAIDSAQSRLGHNNPIVVSGLRGNPVLALLGAPPPVDVTIAVDPSNEALYTSISVFDAGDAEVKWIPRDAAKPYADVLPAGIYRLKSDNPGRGGVKAHPYVSINRRFIFPWMAHV